MKKLRQYVLILASAILVAIPSVASFATTGWKQENGAWSYLIGNASYIGWLDRDGNWYHLNEDGIMQTGWIMVNGSWYYLREDGAMHKGWVELGGSWYYLNDSGAMRMGWLEYNGKWYYLHSGGQMAYNTTVDGYKIDASGVWTSDSASTSTNEKYPLKLEYDKTRSWDEVDRLAIEYYNQYENEIGQLFKELNRVRTQAGAEPLVLDENMCLAATARSVHMISNNYLSHLYNDKNQAVFIANRYEFNYNGEIITGANQIRTSAELIQKFKDSQDHYRIMKLLSSKKVGIGLVPMDGYELKLTIIFSK